MQGKARLLFAALVAFACALPAAAHHSFSLEFDQEMPVDVTGRFVRMDWVNPHSWVYIEVDNPDGTKTEWGAETPPPNILYRQGWRKDFFKPGEELRLEGFAARDGTPNMWASRVFLADGTRVLQMFGGGPPPER
jgi:hypothetical protein